MKISENSRKIFFYENSWKLMKIAKIHENNFANYRRWCPSDYDMIDCDPLLRFRIANLVSLSYEIERTPIFSFITKIII